MVIFHEMVQIQFSLAEWFHSFLVLPAVGFKHDIQTSDTENSRQHSNIYQQRELYNPHGVSQISQPIV